MRRHLEREIDALRRKLLSVGALVEESGRLAVVAIVKRDPETAQQPLRLCGFVIVGGTRLKRMRRIAEAGECARHR